MRNTIPTLGTISWGCRLMRPAVALGLLLVLGFAQPGLAQTNQLNLFKNYFVTGDYVVGGVGLRGLGVNGIATGTINIPDSLQPNPGSVPAGADIVAAFLYWETVEKAASAFAGQHGFFNGYPITGIVLGNGNAPPSWSSGGCAGSSKGTTTLRAYRADVRPFLPVDANGNIQTPNAVTPASYSVSLADSGSNGGGAPLTLGATLVIIYKVLSSPMFPLNSIVLYDGAYAPSNQTTNSEMTQTMQGFYQAAVLTTPVAKLTHIVGDGQTNKSESVMLNSVTLPSPYPANPTVAFPGIYNGSWDNVTWTGNNSAINTAVQPGASAVTTSVLPSGSGGSCVDWGAVIFSTTVEDTNHDGLLAAWKANVNPGPGYTDVISNQFVALPGASPTAQDIFVEVDYLTLRDSTTGTILHSHLPKQLALDKVGDAFAKQSVHIHFDVGTNFNAAGPLIPGCKLTPALPGQGTGCPDPYIVQGGTGGNEIAEDAVACTDGATLCQFPGTPTVGWKEGLLFVKNNATVPNSNPPVPLGNFQFGRKDSYHYVLFGHALGTPRSFWSTFGATEQSTSVAKLISIVNSGIAAMVTIQSPLGLVKPGDCNPANPAPACSDANGNRVTVAGAIGQPALNGTYHFANLQAGPPDSNNVTTTTFTITTVGVANGTYIYNSSNCLGQMPPCFSESRLAVEYGGPTGSSGHSDFRGGADLAVMFGLWPADDAPGCQADPSMTLAPAQTYCVDQVGTITAEAGTLLHEMGHTLTLTHGGQFFPNSASPSGAPAGQQINNPLGAPSYGLNCNPAFLSSMNYLFQIRGFPDLLADGSHPIDYSGQTLPSLSELGLNETSGIGSDLFANQLAAHFTRWYAPPNALDTQLQDTTGGRFATHHCDGTTITDGAHMVRVDGSTFSAPIDWNNDNDPVSDPNPENPVAWQDVNFNGSTLSSPDPPFQGFNDWINVDLRQVGSRASAFGLSGGGTAFDVPGGGSQFDLPGGGSQFDLPGGGTEQDSDTANSTVDPPTGLAAVEQAGAHFVNLNWSAPGFGQIRTYYIWRAASGTPFTKIGNVNGAPPATTFTDPNVKNNATYTYFVTAALGANSGPNNGNQSGPSNMKTITINFSKGATGQ